MSEYAGRVALVTGGAGALGSAIVERLASKGAAVVIADLDGERAAAQAAAIGADALALRFDAEDAASIEAMIAAAAGWRGGIDMLVNNVGRTRVFSGGLDTSVIDTPIETWDRAYAVNVRSIFLACKYALPHLIERRGSIVNIASGSAMAGDTTLVAYATSKAALVMLTKHVAAQYGRRGLRCNAVAPGPVGTPNMQAIAAETLQRALDATYVPALGEPRHIAAAVDYLVSAGAAYTNGAVLNCDGGLTAVLPPWHSSDFSRTDADAEKSR